MATAKKTTKKTAISKGSKATMNDDMYICLHDAINKRKLLLMALKDSLIVQEEYEKILELRTNKKEVLKDIKTHTDSINSKYQEIKKLLPNVKNVLSYTQKELFELESQIDSIKSSMKQEEKILQDEQALEEKLKELVKINDPKKITTKEILPNTTSTSKNTHTPKVSKVTHKPVNKLDRIRNNLSLIEKKLKGL